MEKEQLTGKVEELKGKGKQKVGRAAGSPDLEAQGMVDEGKGKVKQAYGNFKNIVKKADKEAGSKVNDK